MTTDCGVFPAFASHAQVKQVHLLMPRIKIEKRETELRDAYFKRFDKLYPGPMYFRMHVQDVRTSGYPDTQLLGFGRATFWEFKHATPTFKTYGLQEITAQIIDSKTFCRYIIFVQDEVGASIWIVHPSQIRNCAGKLDHVTPEHRFDWDFDAVAQYMHSVHTP